MKKGTRNKRTAALFSEAISDSHIQGLAVQELIVPAVNYGIGSDTTQGVLNRLPLYASVSNASFIYLAIGFNDMKSRSDKDILTTFERILAILPEHKPVVISLLLPIDEDVFKAKGVSNNRISRLNKALMVIFKRFENVITIQPGAKLIDDRRMLSKQYHIGDGVHLNPMGYAIIIDYINQRLEQLSL